jgi:hypothetical protein
MKIKVNKIDSIRYRFEMRFKRGEEHECWLWLGRKNIKGYGYFNIGANKSFPAHRVSYELYVKKIPIGLLVCHSCDNRECVNPNHLWLGTVKENNEDRDKKGRFVALKGEKNGMTKITEKIAKEIKQRIVSGEPMTKIAHDLNINYCIVTNIKSGNTWKHISF